MIRFVVALGLGAAVVLPGAAQQIFHGGTDLVFLSVTVQNGSGQIVSGLTRADFQVFEDGIPQEIANFAQDPQLYGPIEMLNPDTRLVTSAFRKAAEEMEEILARRDQAAFDAIFQEVRSFFGEFAVEATEQSSFLIDRLVERTIG